jgi:hypothetical protein
VKQEKKSLNKFKRKFERHPRRSTEAEKFLHKNPQNRDPDEDDGGVGKGKGKRRLVVKFTKLN